MGEALPYCLSLASRLQLVSGESCLGILGEALPALQGHGGVPARLQPAGALQLEKPLQRSAHRQLESSLCLLQLEKAC